MRVLFVTRPTVFSGPGGDTIQLLQTKKYLEKLDVNVTIADSLDFDFSNFDVVHFFNLRNPQDLLIPVRKAKKLGVPSVLSTIWGSYHEGDIKGREGWYSLLARCLKENHLEYMKAVARVVVNRNFSKNMIMYFLKGHLAAQKAIVSNVDVLLPNSPTELERVRLDMSSPAKKGAVVPNAVDLDVFDSDFVESNEKFKKFENSIVCAARIESRKGQLQLIRAVRGTPYKLVIVGQPSPNSMGYYKKCLKEATNNVHFISHIAHEELAKLYKVARAHALISWMETPGLSSLEAGVMGCNLLVTSKGDTPYYFEDYAVYADPDFVESVRKGIYQVMESPYNENLRKRIINEFNWNKTAEMTLKGYEKALGEYK